MENVSRREADESTDEENSMNFVFISPAYPVTCTYFCNRLKGHGVNVLGIGDVPYDSLNDQLKNSLTEYSAQPRSSSINTEGSTGWSR